MSAGSSARRTLRLGTRGSALARTQSATVGDGLAAAGWPVQTVVVRTAGDVSAAPVEQIGGTGVFVSALRDALHAGEVDLAVHSYKDLPTAAAPGLVIAAVPERADVRDALAARDGLTLGELPPGSRVGTGSPRRQAMLRALGLGLEPVAVRGNVDTRLAMVAQGRLDAVVLAAAGLARLGRRDEATELLDPLQLLPAPAQGALAVECRADDAEVRDALAALHDEEAGLAVAAERAVLAALEAGCTAPVAALAEVVEPEPGTTSAGTRELSLRAVALSPDGSRAVRSSLSALLPPDAPVEAAVTAGRRLASEMLADGADTLLGAA